MCNFLIIWSLSISLAHSINILSLALYTTSHTRPNDSYYHVRYEVIHQNHQETIYPLSLLFSTFRWKGCSHTYLCTLPRIPLLGFALSLKFIEPKNVRNGNLLLKCHLFQQLIWCFWIPLMIRQPTGEMSDPQKYSFVYGPEICFHLISRS